MSTQLKTTLQRMMQQSQEASQPAELFTGTVTSASPLEITVDTAMLPLRQPVLYLTANVVEKKIPLLSHTHELGGQKTEEALEDIAVLENGEALPVEGEYILINRALQAGDRVLLLRVQHGQKFIVLSRIYEGGS